MKFVSKKRFASSVLAGAMAMSLMAPAMAADTNTTTITGKYEPVTLAVTVPNTGSAIINPYGLPIELDEDTVISGQQITTGAPLVISNQSKVALAVTAKVTGTAKGAFTFDSSEVAATESGNKGNVLFEAFEAPGVLDDTDEEDLNVAFAALDSDNAALSAVVGTTEAPTTGDLTLREGVDGETQDGGAAFIRLSGTVAKAPNTAWVAADGFEVKVVFSFEPSTYTLPYDTAPTVGTGSFSAVGDTLTLSLAAPKNVKIDPTSVEWKTDNETNVEFVAGTSTATEAKGSVKVKKATTTSAKTAKVWAVFKDTNGISYKSAEATVTVEKAS